MEKSIVDKIFFQACNDGKYKTINQMENLLKNNDTEENIFYNETIKSLIYDRKIDLNYSTKTGALYL